MAEAVNEGKLAAVRQLFEEQQWQNMTDYDRLQLANIYYHYTTMVHKGLPASKPRFVVMSERRNKEKIAGTADNAKTPPPVDASVCLETGRKCDGEKAEVDYVEIVEDDDVMLAGDTKPTPHTAPVLDRGMSASEPCLQMYERKSIEKMAESGKTDLNGPNDRLRRPLDCKPTVGRSLRAKERVNYAKLFDVDEDENMEMEETKPKPQKTPNLEEEEEEDQYCAVCADWFSKPCAQHPYYLKRDTQATQGSDMYARRSAPSCVQIGVSDIRQAGHGVWAAKPLEPNTVFGPYRGLVSGKLGNGLYSWELDHSTSGQPVFIDASDEKRGNWMRYVNHSQEPNLEAIQWKNNIWYVTKTAILAGQELYVCYGKEYAQSMQLSEPRK